MLFKLIISESVQQELVKITNYLFENWGESSAVKFEKRVDKVLLSISKMPAIGTKVILYRHTIREITLTKQNTLIYEVEFDKVILVKLFDNRQNPNKKYEF
jgi:plasmid stabilization system protein ParE